MLLVREGPQKPLNFYKHSFYAISFSKKYLPVTGHKQNHVETSQSCNIVQYENWQKHQRIHHYEDGFPVDRDGVEEESASGRHFCVKIGGFHYEFYQKIITKKVPMRLFVKN